MELEERRRQRRRYRSAQHSSHRGRLTLTCCDDHDCLGTKDRSYPNRQRLCRNAGSRSAECAYVLRTRRVEQRNSMRACGQSLSRLVEPDVSVDAKPEQQKIETTYRCDRFFVTLAFTVRIGRHSIEAVCLVGIEVDSREQVLRQESPEAADVRRVETDEFIQQERRRVREVGLPC